MDGDLVAAIGQLVAEQVAERVVGELRLLQADHIGTAFVQPGQQPRQPLLDRVHVPGRDPHPADGTRRAEKGVLGSPCLRKGSK